MITDGFSEANSLSEMPGSIIVSEVALGGVISRVSRQECQGLAQDGQHGWFHLGIDLVVEATGEVIDSLPLQLDSSEEHPGHYQLEAIEAVVAKVQTSYREAYDKTVASCEAKGEAFDNDKWVSSFRDMADYRKAEKRFYAMMEAMLMLGMDDDDDEDEDDDFPLMGRLMGDDKVDSLVERLLGDFDPDEVAPTDEGL